MNKLNGRKLGLTKEPEAIKLQALTI